MNAALSATEIWGDYDARAAAIDRWFSPRLRSGMIPYLHPEELQAATAPAFRRPFVAPVAYVEWGAPTAPAVVCIGGVANTARRFDYLASALCDRYRVIAMDWIGRGSSGWLPQQSDYSFETNVEQLAQLLDALDLRQAVLIGSSLGGSVGLALSARRPAAFRAIVLNDIGPFLPRERRIRRAETLARHYVFRTPAELLRRVGASQKHDGPLDPSIVLHNSYHLTRWSEEESGRVYRHDLRALQAYRNEAERDIDQWPAWEQLPVPVLVLHGAESDALLPDTIARMRARPQTTVVHIAATGHTPALAEPNQIAVIGRWLDDQLSIADDAVILPAEPGSYPAP